jgi:hypothetical protein
MKEEGRMKKAERDIVYECERCHPFRVGINHF